ncbi:Pvc16 family protein [Hydrogenimonas sp.]
MIKKIDELLETYLFYELGEPDSSVLEFSFELPDRKWSDGIDQDTVNLYLLDIDENRELRKNEWERRYEGTEVRSSKPPAMVDLYYIVTLYAKPSDPAKEHDLLGRVVTALYRFDSVAKEGFGFTPELEHVAGSVSLELFPKSYIDDRLGLQLWSAIDQSARPLVLLRVTTPFDLSLERGGGIVRSKEISFVPLKERLYAVSGRVVSEAAGVLVPLPGAEVELKEGAQRLQMRRCDAKGRFALMRIPEKPLSLVVTAEGYKSGTVELPGVAEASKEPLTVVLEKEST